MTVRIVPRPIVRGLTFVCWIDRTKFMARRSTPVPSAKVGLLIVAPKFPPKTAATEPNQTRKSPQQTLVRVSERNSQVEVLSGCRCYIHVLLRFHEDAARTHRVTV